MRDARSGGGKSRPRLISEHGAGQQANKKPVVSRVRPVAASSRGHAGVAQLLTPRRPQKPTRDYPGAAFHGPGWKKQSPVHITQSLLEDVGLGGAAHPIRRLQHPGGRMEFPGFGGARLTVKAARAELEASPIRNAFHTNIEKTVPDAGIAKGLKKAYDTQVLRASRNHGIGPNEYLKRVHEQHGGPAPYVSKGHDLHGSVPHKAYEKGFLYHRTSEEHFKAIQKHGLSPTKPAGDNPVGVYFANEPLQAAGLAWKNVRNSVHLRVAKSKVKNLDESRAFGESLTTSHVPPEHLEYLGTDGSWHKLAEHKPGASEAVQKAQAGLASAPAAYRATKPVRSEELGKRVEKMGAAMAKGTGSEAIRAGLRELKGPLPSAEFHGLLHMTDAEMETLAEHIRVSDKLTELEKGTAWKSIQDARNTRKPPPPHAQKILERAFGPEISRELFHPSNFKGHLKHVVIETVNVPRAVMSSADLSAPARQGLVGLISHPVISSKELGPMVRAFGSEAHYKNFFEHVAKDPYYERALKDRLPITDVEHSLANREEAFQSNYAERIPAVGHLVRGSGRAYTRFLVGQRFGIYKHVAQHAEDAGISLDAVGKNGQTVGEQIADLASAATGRGQGRRNGFFERNAVELNAALFSPRLIKSRFDFLNPLAYHRLDPVVRVEKMKMAAKTAVAISTFLYAMSKVPGVKVQADPRSTDFGKIRIGNTRIDVAGGFNQYIRFVAQEVSNGSIDVNTGEIKHGQGIAILNRFWRSKLSPPAGLGTSLVFRSNYAGQPIDPTSGDFWKQQAGNLGTPLAGQDAKGVLDATHSWPKAIGAYGIGSIGAGVQNYGPPAPTGKTPEDLRNDLRANVRKYFNRGLTPQLKEALKLRETRETYLKKVAPKRPGRGASEEEKTAYTLQRFNAQVDLMVKLGKINRGQARKAKSWARSQDRHKVNSETSRVGRKYFGGAALSDATKKIREKGGHLYLGDY